MGNQEVMLHYWGKALKGEKNAPYHLLVYHVLDVAAVAEVWWRHSSVIRQRFNHATGLDEAQTHAWTLFFIALHDYGKWDIRFQLKAVDALKALFSKYNYNISL